MPNVQTLAENLEIWLYITITMKHMCFFTAKQFKILIPIKSFWKLWYKSYLICHTIYLGYLRRKKNTDFLTPQKDEANDQKFKTKKLLNTESGNLGSGSVKNKNFERNKNNAL